jgi:hypothetical protein
LEKALIDLTKLSFGAPAAERDIAQGLAEYFVESDAFGRLVARQKTIVIGNRGTGKSALFKVLADRARKTGVIVLELSPENYSYEMLCNALKAEKEGSWAKHGAFASAWKYLIYVLVMKQVSEHGAKLKRGAAEKIYTYLRDNHSGVTDSPIAVLISYLKRMEGIKIAGYEAALKTRELAKLYRLEEIEPLLPHLAELTARRKVLVLVDELDKGWDTTEDAKAFVSGLFHACVSINEKDPNLTVYVSLRQELYDSIPALYDDAQKYRDIIETIRWDETTLLAVVANRIRYSLPELQDKSDAEAWASVFAETLQYRKNRSFNYMIDRTLYRPREIIQFCTDSVEEARSQKTVPIDYGVISRAELLYSDARQKDIAGEYRFQYPGLQSIFELFRGRTYLMERNELSELCLTVSIGETKVDKEARWALDQDPDYLIEVLWRVGFLRAYAVGGLKAMRRSGSSYVGPHQVSTLNLQGITRFQVHPMFRASLGMKEPKREVSSPEDD